MATCPKCLIYQAVHFLAANIKDAEVDPCRVRQGKVDTRRGVKGVGIVLSEREVCRLGFCAVSALVGDDIPSIHRRSTSVPSWSNTLVPIGGMRNELKF